MRGLMLLYCRYFLMLALFVFSGLSAMRDQPSLHRALLDRPEYKKLATEFGKDALETALTNHSSNSHTDRNFLPCWSGIARSVIGSGNAYATEQQRYLIVNVMLHDARNPGQVRQLYDCFIEHQNCSFNPHHPKKGINTPEGIVYTQMESDDYTKVMAISNDIRSKIFVNGISPLVLVRKAEGELNISTKWFLYEASVVIMYLISLCFKKEEKKDQKENGKKEENGSLLNFLDMSYLLQRMEEAMQKDLEKSFPILETHTVKSLVDDKTFWLYDRNNWIKGGSALSIVLLAYALIYDKLPDVTHRVYSVIFVA